MDMEELKTEFEKLVEVMTLLRGPEGCEWDRAQDYYSLQSCIIEEAYEVVEALQNDNLSALPVELGDLLLQVVFQAQIGREKGDFDLVEVIKAIKGKLIRRHPHVFADREVKNIQEILDNWDRIKENEKSAENNEGMGSSRMDQVSQVNPALIQSYEVQQKAAEVGFDWQEICSVLDKIEEEVKEVREVIEAEKKEMLKEEIGDLLFSVVNLARFAELNPEQALLLSLNKFKNRFKFIEQKMEKDGLNLEEENLEVLEKYWNLAKKREGSLQ